MKKITATIAALLLAVLQANAAYELVWSEEFDGSALDTDVWNYEIGTGNWGWGNGESQYYTNRSENVRIEDGNLVIHAKKENYNGSEYTSARITTRRRGRTCCRHKSVFLFATNRALVVM